MCYCYSFPYQIKECSITSSFVSSGECYCLLCIPSLPASAVCLRKGSMQSLSIICGLRVWLCAEHHDLCLSQLTTGAKLASIAGQQEEVVNFWAKPYRRKLQALPAYNKFSTMWSAFQTPQGNLGDEVEFDKHGPLLNIYRPQSAKVWPNRRWSLYDFFHADLPRAQYPAVIVVARKLLIQRLPQLLSERNLLHVLLGLIFVALCHIHEVAW